MHTHFAAVTAENKSKFSIEHFCFCSREKYFNCIHDSTEKKIVKTNKKVLTRTVLSLFGIERVLLDIDVAYYLLLAIFLKIARNLLLNFDAVLCN